MGQQYVSSDTDYLVYVVYPIRVHEGFLSSFNAGISGGKSRLRELRRWTGHVGHAHQQQERSSAHLTPHSTRLPPSGRRSPHREHRDVELLSGYVVKVMRFILRETL